MNTECKPKQLEFQSLGRREVIGRFDGGRITSDGGGLLQDFHAKIFAQNLTAIFVRLAQWLADARYQHRRHGYRINFANALSKMKNNLVRLFLETSPLDLSWRLLQRMADAVVAVRPGRKFPRDMKKVRVPGFQMQYRRTR